MESDQWYRVFCWRTICVGHDRCPYSHLSCRRVGAAAAAYPLEDIPHYRAVPRSDHEEDIGLQVDRPA